MKYCHIASPIGTLTISTDGQALTGLHIAGDKYFTTPPVDWILDPQDPLLKKAVRQLEEYLAGKRKKFDLPLAPQGTAFQQQVWKALGDVPCGSRASYGDIARQIGRPTAVRAVGAAIGRNPICLLIPCHRVVGNLGQLTGFVAGTACKQALLSLEAA